MLPQRFRRITTRHHGSLQDLLPDLYLIGVGWNCSIHVSEQSPYRGSARGAITPAESASQLPTFQLCAIRPIWAPAKLRLFTGEHQAVLRAFTSTGCA
jgi:hypothetical protein